jgi:hypothetical protein
MTMLPSIRRPIVLSIVLVPFLVGCGSTTTTSPAAAASPPGSNLPGSLDDLLFTSDVYAGSPNGLLEVYSLQSAGGTPPKRLTLCNSGSTPCASLEAASSPDKTRLAVRRVVTDTNGDGLLTAADSAELDYVDLSQPADVVFAPTSAQVNGVDWSALDTDIVYSGAGPSGEEDLFDIGTTGQSLVNLTQSLNTRERSPRFDATGTVLVFERIDAGQKGTVWILDQNGNETEVDAGAPGLAPLPGTPYIVGGDADPAFSPDGNSVVFRRLTGIGNGGLGTWDLVVTNGTTATTVVTGPLYRGAPDWGPNGIVFVETDALGRSSLVVVAQDGSGRRAVFSPPAGFTVASPRWLP